MAQAGALTHDEPGAPPAPELCHLLGVAREDEVAATVASLVRDALGLTVAGGVRVEPVDYTSGSPATGGLARLHGESTEGPRWSLFCKVLQSPRHWPMLALLPPTAAQKFVDEFPWRAELDLWDPAVQASLPIGLRSPRLHRVVELGDDRVAVWMEDVQEAPPVADLTRFDRAAYLLGRWNARCTDAETLSAPGLPVGYALRMYVEQSVRLRGLGSLHSDSLWDHPWLAPHAALRADLLALGEQIPGLLDRLDTFAQALPHGDASPQNLLVPADDPESFVVIDLSFRTPHALGFDLGQLLVGLTHAGLVPAALLPEIAGRIVPAYLRGLWAEGMTGHDDDVRWAFSVATLLRSGFDSFLYGLLDDPTDEHRHTFDERVALCRFLADQALTALAD